MSKKKNPVPKIGRSIKRGYQTPSFKPTKKFEKQFPKAEKKREAAVKRQQPPQPKGDYFEQLKELGEKVRRGEIKIRHMQPPEADVIDKIAVLSNIYDIDNAAEILDIDVDLLDRFVAGGRLNRSESDEINGGYYDMRRNDETQDLYNIDLPYIDKTSAIIGQQLGYLGNDEQRNAFRLAIADQDLDIDKFAEKGLLFRELSEGHQMGRITERYMEQREILNSGGHIPKKQLIDLNEMFDNFFDDDRDIWDVDESLFWAWFREIFYP